MLLSPRFQMAETETLGTRIRSYFRPEDADAGRVALRDAVAAFQVYSDRYGPYPYRDMAIVEAPLTFHGMEFPGVSLIGSQDYSQYRKDLETLVVHEVAHQWWYNQVGSDQIMNPWLDEGLAEFSMYDYFAARYGEPKAQQLRELRWQIPTASLVRRGKDAAIGLPVRDYKENYETLVYGKGAEFFATLRDELGAGDLRPAAADLSGTLSLAHRHAGGVSRAGGGSFRQGFGGAVWGVGGRGRSKARQKQRPPHRESSSRGTAPCLLGVSVFPYEPTFAVTGTFSGTKNRFAFTTVPGRSVQKLFLFTFCHTRFGR